MMLVTIEGTDRRYRAPALEKGLDILEVLALRGTDMTASQLSAQTGRSVSELFRMIQVLEFRGYIEHSDGAYRLSNRLFSIGMRQAMIRSVLESALPHMTNLSTKTMQSCHLLVASGDQVVVVARVESPGELGYSLRVGHRRNLIESSSGLLFYGCAAPQAKSLLHKDLVASFGGAAVRRFAKQADEIAQLGQVERPSDVVRGVTELVSPILSVHGIIGTLLVPFIESVPQVCGLQEAGDELRAIAANISSENQSAAQV